MHKIDFLPKPKGILFDLGDTLVTVKFHQDGGLRRLMPLAVNPRKVTIDEVIAECNRLGAVLQLLNLQGWEVYNLSQFLKNVFDKFEITFPQGNDIIDLEFTRGAHDLEPEPQLFDMLDEISKLDIPLGIISNTVVSGKSLNTILGEIGMLKYFEFLISSADYGFAKPHPEIFNTAVAKLGTNPEETWFIGNVIDIDVDGAESAGLTGIWYNQHKVDLPNEVLPEYQVRSWSEFLQMVKSVMDPVNE